LRGAKYTRDKEEFGEKTFPSFRPKEREGGIHPARRKFIGAIKNIVGLNDVKAK
jgi:hypothetical protein